MSFWWAFRSHDAAEVIEHLELTDTRKSSFADGMSAVGTTVVDETLFVTQPRDGWVVVFGAFPDDLALLELRLKLGSIQFGEAQAFASDDQGRRAWLRSHDGDLGRCMVFDGTGYPFTRGERAPGEPQFPQLLATPSDGDVSAVARSWSLDPRCVEVPGIVGKRQLAIRLGRDDDEEDEPYFVRVGAAYLQHRWDRDVFSGDCTGMDPPPFTILWPRHWGQPANRDGTLEWQLPAAQVSLQIRDEVNSVPPTINHWIDHRRELAARSGWKVIGGQKLHHDFGVGMETGELTVGPRTMRATRWLFAPPWMVMMSLSCPDEIPHERGRELAWLYYSLRIR